MKSTNLEPMIAFVRGDAVEKTLELPCVEPEKVNKIFLSCVDADLEVPCTLEDGKVCVKLSSEQTMALEPMITDYDLVIELSDGNRVTPISEALFAILQRGNPYGELKREDEE